LQALPSRWRRTSVSVQGFQFHGTLQDEKLQVQGVRFLITVIVAKALWVLGGAALGWLAKKWHVQPLLDAIEEQAKDAAKK
jgi:hypothetical protein